jgi:hypothetical protein
LIAELFKFISTSHSLTTPYSKEENGIVERMNKEVLRHLRAMLSHSAVVDKWSCDQLPLVARILNSHMKEATGISPARLLFGAAVDLDRFILHPNKEESYPSRGKLPIPI